MQPAGENSAESCIQLHVQILLSKIAEIEAMLRAAWTYQPAASQPNPDTHPPP
jgi:hypothetical protein